MTTIILTPEGAWTDGAATRDGTLSPEAQFKKAFRWSSGVVGICGAPVDPKPLFLWFEEYLTGNCRPWPYLPDDGESIGFTALFGFQRDMTAVWVAAPGTVYQRIPIGAYQASGSGKDYARAALMAGAGPLDALRIAARLDPYTAPPFSFLAFDPAQPIQTFAE